jgi:hypothetical protein
MWLLYFKDLRSIASETGLNARDVEKAYFEKDLMGGNPDDKFEKFKIEMEKRFEDFQKEINQQYAKSKRS